MGTYQEAMRQLNKAQRQAVETIEGPVLVIAGPGTGKTQLLNTRITHILAKTDTLPQNILCLTYTESAAQTMQERLTGMIGQNAYDVRISTYHGFGRELIHRFPEYFTEDAEQRPVDDLTIDRILRQIVRDLPYTNPLKYSDAYLGDIKTLISDAKRALLTPDDLRTIAKENLVFIKQVSPIIRRTLDSIARIDKKAIPLFSKLAVQLRYKPNNQKWRPLSQLFLGELEEAVSAAEESRKTTRLTVWKNDWLAKDEKGQFIADGVKSNQKLLAVAEVYEQYLLALKARDFFDYDDMILRAVKALETNPELRYTLQEQYLYILLDEFQDTNEAQLRLVELLTDSPVHEGRPNVMAVGDDDQAIYAFQGADYSHMLKFKDMYKGVVAVPLTENYRSHSDILHTARGIAEQIEERLHHHFPAIEKTLTAAAKDLPKTAIVERREAKSDVMQYAWVTKLVKELIESGVSPEEIAVLAPLHKHLEPLVPFLNEAGIPVRYEKRENVLDDSAVNELLVMAELVTALGAGKHEVANSLWPQVLSLSFWGLETSQIWRLSWKASDEHRNWTDELLEDQKLKIVALFFIRLSQMSGTETLENMMDYLIGSRPLDLSEPDIKSFRSPYYEHYFGELASGSLTINADFWNLLTNLIVLRARLREYQKDGESRLSLVDLVEFAHAHRSAEIKIQSTSPYASGTEAVQLMTAYKAKGMEFKAVFILATNDETWGNRSRTQMARLALPPNLRYIRYAGATEDERLRLFYVAITRAKSQLYLVNYLQSYAGKKMTRLKYLNETADEQENINSPLLPGNNKVVLPAEEGASEPTTELAAYWQQRHQTLADADLRALLRERLRVFQLSPTHMGDFLDVAHMGPQAFFLRTILGFPESPRPEMHYGSAIHETLEWMHHSLKQNGKLAGVQMVQQIFATKLKAKRLSDKDHQLFLDRGKRSLTAYLKQRANMISADNVVEHNFRREGVLVGEAHLSGKIDKLIVNKKAKTVTIVDYKTSRSHLRWSRDISLHKYRHQLYLYRALVEGSHTFAGYHVEDAYLEFVEPDEAGKIQDLHLKFNETEYRRVKELAQAVWRKIKALDLPDTTGYKLDLAGIETFEADLLENK